MTEPGVPTGMVSSQPRKFMLTFDEKEHSYSVDGRLVPGVTTVLAGVGLIDASWFSEYAATRGTYVHEATALYDRGELDEESLDPALTGYLGAYKRFRREVFSGEWQSIETPSYHATGFAGTPDRVHPKMVVDIKSGAKLPWHPIQLAAYAILAHNCVNGYGIERLGLYLHDDGTYKLYNYKNPNDFEVWRACLTVYNAKRRLI